MLKSLEKLLKILNIEIQAGYLDKAIIGGLDKFYPNWLNEAQAEKVPDELIHQVGSMFTGYSTMDPSDRETAIKATLAMIRAHTKTTSPATNDHNTQDQKNTHLFDQNPPANFHDSSDIPHTEMVRPATSPAGLKTSLTVLQGIGSVKNELFQSLGVHNIEELLYYFPRRYVDYSTLKTINRIEYGEELTIIATVKSSMTTPIHRRNQARVEVVVTDTTGYLRLVFFRSLKYIQSFENYFKPGTQLVISGKVTMYLGRKQMNDPAFESLDASHLNTNRITPVYPLTSGLTQKDLRSAVNMALRFYVTRVADFLPADIRNSANLVDLPVALHQVHYPDSFKLLRSAQDRLAFDEIFFLQLGVQQQKRAWQEIPASRFELSDDVAKTIVERLPFELTTAQERVLTEIQQDLASGKPMNRLVQGDVGSGKTIVAAIASTAVNLAGGQSALMAPTSILAEQHYQSLLKTLSGDETSGLPLHPHQIRLLTGDTSPREREEISNGCVDGTIRILIGTHALIEDPVKFANLQLAIVDEQHRFGIAQRAALRQKGENPHLLVMSATPIPRSLALTLFGDLDISIIDEMPAGRKPVDTRIIHPFDREKAYNLINTEIQQGHQAFIIYPLIDKGDDEDKKAAVDEHTYLQKDVFAHLKLGLLHGRMPADEKERVMREFRERKYDILVSTTVIEVGVDVPNATVMLIEGANRFGLAQLHQLRGRVGRGGDTAYCLLIPENEDAIENERLAVMTETTDGFILAEKDLEQRGPGDFIGFRQSGYADLRMASLTDIRLIEKARHYAQEILKDDPLLQSEEHQVIARRLADLWKAEAGDIS